MGQRDQILTHSPALQPDDVRSTSMGAGGEDVQLSPAARKKFPFSVECKAKSKVAVYSMYEQATENCPGGAEPLLVVKGDRKKPLAIVDAEWFLNKMVQK